MRINAYMTGPLQVNTYLVIDKEQKVGMVVDPGGHSQKLIDDIRRDCDNLKYIFLTHGHGDHIGGVKELLTIFPEAKLLTGKGEVEILGNAVYNSSTDFFEDKIEFKAKELTLLGEGDEIEVGNIVFRVIETPGHTPGGLSLYTDGIVFTGDTLFKLSVGRTDFYGGSWEQLLDSVKNKLFKLPDDTVVLPGHMAQSNIGFEKKYNEFL